MEEIFKLLCDKEVYDDILSKFSIEGRDLLIDTDELSVLAKKTKALTNNYVALNLNGGGIVSQKHIILSNITADDLMYLLGEVFAFDPTTSKKDVIVTNYLDAIINWYKIPVIIPILTVGDDRVLVNMDHHYAAPVMPIELGVENSTLNLQALMYRSLNKYVEEHDGTLSEMISFNMTSNLVFSPLLPTVIRVNISEETADKLQYDSGAYEIDTIENYSNGLMTEMTINKNGDSMPDPFAKALGTMIKVLFK